MEKIRPIIRTVKLECNLRKGKVMPKFPQPSHRVIFRCETCKAKFTDSDSCLQDAINHALKLEHVVFRVIKKELLIDGRQTDLFS